MSRTKPFIGIAPSTIEDGTNDPNQVDTTENNKTELLKLGKSNAPRPELGKSNAPRPGSTNRDKQPLTTAKTPRPRKLLTPEELTAKETSLTNKYKHIAKGSLKNATKGNPMDGLTDTEIQKYKHKRSVTITCQTTNCEETRRIATSDLAQVKHCENCTRLNRNQRKRQRRATTKAASQNNETITPK